jgi:putative ABC transport system permease protein
MLTTLRALARSPSTAVVAVAALGLGIGLTATLFSAVEGVFLRGLPFADADRLVEIHAHDLARGIERMPPRPEDVAAWEREAKSFSDLAAWQGVGMTVSGGEAVAERYNGSWITPGLFDLLGAAPLLGRDLRAADGREGAEPVVVVSHRLWRQQLGGEPAALGRALRLHGRPVTVVGVMPEGLRFPLNQDFWLPLDLDSAAGPRRWGSTRLYGLQVVGRLAAGVSLAQARAEMATLAAALAGEGPEARRGVGVSVEPYVEAYTDPAVRGNLLALLGAVFAVLLVACANVATLLLARGAERAGELAVRQALGAGRRHLAGQVLGEAALLAAGGGLLGVLVAAAGSRLLQRLLQAELLSFWIDVRLDGRVLLFTLGLTLVACLAAGLAPALRLARADLRRALPGAPGGTAGPGRGRLVRALVVAEVAACSALLAAAGLTGKSVVRLRAVEVGFETDGLLAAGASLSSASYPDTDSRRAFADRLLDRLTALPGAAGAALTSALPLDRRYGETAVEVEGAAPDAAPPAVRRAAVTPGYFHLLGVGPLAGREIETADRLQAPPVAVVEESFARRVLGGGDPLGRRLRFSPDEPWRTVVGVVPDLGSDRLPEEPRGFLPIVQGPAQGEPPAAVFLPFAQDPAPWATLVVRAIGDPRALIPSLRREVAALDPDLALVGVATVDDEIADATWDYRLFSRVLAVFAAAALLLAALGLYGVVAFAVERRTREVGLRLALGSDRGGVLRLILGAGLAQVAAGLAVGLALGLLLARALRGLLFEVEPWDPAVLAAVTAVLLAAGLAATWLPARRAAAVEPATALRGE